MSEVEILKETEALELGLSTTVVKGDPDNPLLDQMLDGTLEDEEGMHLPGSDSQGRPIISYKQYLDLAKRPNFHDMHKMAIRMYFQAADGRKVTKAFPANKLQKFWGQGYRPMGWKPEKVQKQNLKPIRPQPEGESTDTPKVFFCADIYPDCPRFFDTPDGLKFHVRKSHEGGLKKKTASK